MWLKKSIIHLCLFCAFCGSNTYAQISPGPLSKAHAQLEGMSNCTLCHDLGDQVSDKKCLECHTEIQTLLDGDRGYHAHPTVESKNCFDCHSEHHGRNFDMMRFDEDSFDHSLTGYELEGQHSVIDCRKCHIPEYIHDEELKKRENTFLGLDTKCLSCHEDYHQETLSNDCISCHNIEAFSPVPNFDHDDAAFPLKGMHATLDCIDCHQSKTSFRFDRVGNECINCHQQDFTNTLIPNHQASNFSTDCMECHANSNFFDWREARVANHDAEFFPIYSGVHKNVWNECIACHNSPNNFTDFNCLTCHSNPRTNNLHQNIGGYIYENNACLDCHPSP